MKVFAANFEVPQIENPSAFGDLGALISVLLQAALIVAGLGALAFLIMGGIQFLTSGGDKAGTEAARGRITYAIIGLALVVGAYAIVRILETIFGVSIVSGIKWPGPCTPTEVAQQRAPYQNCIGTMSREWCSQQFPCGIL